MERLDRARAAWPAPELDADGPAAPPRLNGELVFNAPWESRSFAMAFALAERGEFSWDEFRDRLIDSIARWESRHGVNPSGAAESDETDEPDEPYQYYERWQEALESILAERSIVPPADLKARVQAFAARPSGHDHPHRHRHDHPHRHRHDHPHRH